MYAVLICRDKPDSLALRKATRDEHLAYLAETGVVEIAGPLLDDDGNPAGSLLIIRVETLDEARGWADRDPYAKAGLFESVKIQQWNKVIV